MSLVSSLSNMMVSLVASILALRSGIGEIAVSSAAAPSPNTAATTAEAAQGSTEVDVWNHDWRCGKAAASSIAIIEEDKDDPQALKDSP